MASIEIEARAYGPDSTPQEVEALRDRVRRHADDVVLYDEIPVITPFSINTCYDHVEELVDAHGCRLLIVDVRGAGRPDAKMRKVIHGRMIRLQGRIVRVGIVMKANPLIKAATRFIQSTAPLPLSVYDTVEQAEQELRSGLE